jgi:hypothetical protein
VGRGRDLCIFHYFQVNQVTEAHVKL